MRWQTAACSVETCVAPGAPLTRRRARSRGGLQAGNFVVRLLSTSLRLNDFKVFFLFLFKNKQTPEQSFPDPSKNFHQADPLLISFYSCGPVGGRKQVGRPCTFPGKIRCWRTTSPSMAACGLSWGLGTASRDGSHDKVYLE